MQFDVIVVGAGGSGLAAAYSAVQHGAKVLILEKQPQPGGTTGIAVGSFTAACTSLQREAGVDDNLTDHIADVARFAPAEIEEQNNPELREFFLRSAAETFDWLRGLGLSFVGPSPEPPNRVPRMHNVVPGGKAYIAAFQLRLQKAGVELICSASVESLLKSDEGRVRGVVANVDGHRHEYQARKGVILAAGDYANDPQMIGEHKGDRFRNVEGINPYSCGDGQRLAAENGACMLNMGITYGPELRFIPASKRPFQQWLPAHGLSARLMGLVARCLPAWAVRMIIKRLLVTWQHPENQLFEDGAILLNSQGRRFVNEKSWPEREIGVADQTDKTAYMLLDGRLVRKYSAWPHFVSTAPDIVYAYVKDYQRLRPDVTITGLTVEDVALRRGLDAPAVADTVGRYNAYVRGNGKDPFGRTGDIEPLDQGPWVLLGPLKAYFTTTEGGARVNQHLQICTPDGDVIPGLFAVGQNGLGGMVLFGHGLHIAWALTSGRLAGKAIVELDD